MSGGGNLDPLPIISPLLPSPLAGGVRHALPLLSPLLTTPTPPNPPAKLPPIATPLPSSPQLVPTTGQTKSLGSTQPHQTSSAADIETEIESEMKISTGSVSFVHSLKEASSVESTGRSPETAVKLASVEKPQSTTATEKTDKPTYESFSPSPPRVNSPEAKGEEGESLSDEESPSPEETQSDIPVETRVTESSLYSPSTLPLTSTPAISSPQLQPVREKSAVQSGEEEDDNDNESIISSASSKASLEEPEKPEIETGFSLNQSMGEEERASLTAELVRLRSCEVADINTEGGGEGGVACILDDDEEEMDIPDIDKQLELSESDDSSSSGTSSGSEGETGRKVPEVEEEEVRIFLEPPKAAVRSSSHSLASTPSVSPSPSPIPGSTSLHSIPVSVSDPLPPPTDPYLKPSPVSFGLKDVAKSARQVPLSQHRESTGSFVVTIKTGLVPSLRERGRRGREGGGGRNRRRRKEPSSRSASLQKDSEKKQKKRFPPLQRSLQSPVASAKIKSEPHAPHSPLIICIKRSLLHQESPLVTTSDLLPQPEYDEEEEEEDDDDDVIVTHSSAERVKFKPPAIERVKTETPSSKGWYPGQGSQYSAPEGPTPGQGVWRRELDISEMGLVAPPPPVLSQETQHVRIIPQPSSSSSSGDSDSTDSESSSPSPLSHPPAPSPAPSPWQRPIRSEDEESTSSGATVGSGGLKLKLKISKAFLQSMPILGKQSPGKPDKKHRKKGAAATDSMATTSRGGREGQSRKRGRSNKNPQKAGKKGGSNIPQIKLPKLELSALPGATSSSSWKQTTPRSGRAGLFPPLKLPGVAVSPGGEVWYCPHCSKPDDGSPMIGCDGSCEGWYHW
ncbi:Transcription initiation factor TFIID subunit 3 [Geodia barretti]|nr:Transcription initiation factor TFIID subunit 3 [Geodia barretti]